MQKVYVVWDDGKASSNPYRHVNEDLERGAKVVSVTTAAPSESVTRQPWAVSVFVLEMDP